MSPSSKLLALGYMAAIAAAAATNTELRTSFPKATGTTELSSVKTLGPGESLDGGMKMWDRNPSTCKQQEETGDDDAVFILEDGATLSNVIIGPNNGQGIHCMGSCTLNNVWWTDVCEDAATFKQKSGTSYVNGGGARKASDKVLQHNGGGTVAVKNFYAEDIGKLYRSCGNCDKQYARHSTFDNIKVDGAKTLAGVNGNLGDTTVISNSCVLDSDICEVFKGNDNGDEPKKVSSKPDGKACIAKSIKTSGC